VGKQPENVFTPEKEKNIFQGERGESAIVAPPADPFELDVDCKKGDALIPSKGSSGERGSTVLHSSSRKKKGISLP